MQSPNIELVINLKTACAASSPRLSAARRRGRLRRTRSC